MILKTRIALLASLMVSALSAHAYTIDFETHGTDFGNPIFDSGFTFDTTAAGWGVFGPGSGACCSVNYNGTTSFFADGDRDDGNATMVMSVTGGGTFDIATFDAATYFGSSAGLITILGTFDGGGTISTNIDISDRWTTYTLTGYTNLVSLRFTDGNSGGFLDAPGFGIDNVTNVSAIPEPETYAMLLAGLGVLGFASRRRKLKEAAPA